MKANTKFGESLRASLIIAMILGLITLLSAPILMVLDPKLDLFVILRWGLILVVMVLVEGVLWGWFWYTDSGRVFRAEYRALVRSAVRMPFKVTRSFRDAISRHRR